MPALKAIGDHFRIRGRPRNLTAIHPIAAGDMYGIDGVNHLAQTGLLKRVIVGSLPSGTSSMGIPADLAHDHQRRNRGI